MFNVKILGISCSPRRGNTEILIKEALKAAEELEDIETKFISLYGKKINPCTHCMGCVKNRSLCIQKDDMEEIFPKIIEADGIIIGSPTYFHMLNAQTKALMDRTTCLIKWITRPDWPIKVDFWKKVGGAISVGAGRFGGQEHTLEMIVQYFLTLDMIVVSGNLSYFSSTYEESVDELGIRRMPKPPDSYIGAAAWTHGRYELDAVKQDSLGLKASRQVGMRVAKTAKLIKIGLEALEIKYSPI